MVVTLGGVVLVGAGLLLMHRFTGRGGLRLKPSTIGGLVSGAVCVIVGALVIVLGLR